MFTFHRHRHSICWSANDAVFAFHLFCSFRLLFFVVVADHFCSFFLFFFEICFLPINSGKYYWITLVWDYGKMVAQTKDIYLNGHTQVKPFSASYSFDAKLNKMIHLLRVKNQFVCKCNGHVEMKKKNC